MRQRTLVLFLVEGRCGVGRKRCRTSSGLLLRRSRHRDTFLHRWSLLGAFFYFNLPASVKLQDQDRVPPPLHCDWLGRSGAPLGSGAPDPIVAAAVKLCHSAEEHSKPRVTVALPQRS